MSKFLFVCAISGMLISGMILPVWATTDLTAYLPISGNAITPSFKFTKVIFIDYKNGGKLESALNGKNMTISFTTDSSNNTSTANFMQILDNAIRDQKSSATITNLKVNYIVQINGGSDEASITYLIQLTPTITGYVMYQGTNTVKASVGGGGTPFILDASWAGFDINQDVTLSTPTYGNLEINYPISLIQKELPVVYGAIKGSNAEKLLEENLLDASPLFKQQPLSSWDHLFDPSYIVSGETAYQYKGTKIAVTTFSSGVSTIQAGVMNAKQEDADFTSDALYHLRTIEQPASGTFDVEGQAQAYDVGGAPAFTTTPVAASNVSNTTAGGISGMVMYGMAAFGGAIAVFVFIWSNKKMKSDKNRKPDAPWGPIQYEQRQQWADKFDESVKSNTSAVMAKEEKEEKDWLCFKCGYYTLTSQDHCSNCGAARPT
ncbi:hypothetical protein [Candidatus Nitrosotalea sp. TS]|uniref:hypothetical protein n=1 Tax=Candidatus Nitrosotalea sp. TS TaxID=2341020 RepID=UPI00140B757F|nr:hypothetical protein [Candidatus Nitrosotalea sp. TS]